MPELTPQLSYARTVDTYVGQPVNEIKALTSELDDRHKSNRGDADKLEILAYNTKVLDNDNDNEIKSEAFSNIKQGLNDFDYGNNWEDADEKVRSLTKGFAMNSALNKAKQNKLARDSGVAELQEATAEGKIPKEWMNYEIMRADEGYQGVSMNEETGEFEGTYGLNRPSDYIDIGKEMWDLAKDVKAGKEPLWLDKTDGTRDYIIHTEKGYLYEGTLKSVEPDKIQGALRGMIMNNENYKGQIKYENDLLKWKMTRTGVKEQPNRPLNSDDFRSLQASNVINNKDLQIALSSFGEDVRVEDLEAEGYLDSFFDAVMYGKKVDSFIDPAAIGQSFSEMDVSSKKDFISAEAIKYNRTRKDELAEENKDKAAYILSSHGIKIHNPTQLNSEVQNNGELGITNETKDLNSSLKTLESSITNNYKIIDNKNASVEDVETAKKSNEDLLSQFYTNKNRRDYLNEVSNEQYWKHLYETNKISKDEYNAKVDGIDSKSIQIEKDKTNIDKKLNTIFDEFSLEGKAFHIGGALPYVRDLDTEEIVNYLKTGDGDSEGRRQYFVLKDLISQGKIPKDILNELEGVSSSVKAKDKTNEIFENKDLFKKYLDTKIDEAYEPAVFDFSTNVKNPEKLSFLSQTLSNHVKRNKNGYIVYDQDGQQTNLDSDESPLYNQNDITITGSTDFVPNQGIMLKGYVDVTKENSSTGKLEKTGERREILLKPRESNQEARMVIQNSLRKDYNKWDLAKGENATYGNGVEYADAIVQTDIESQGDIFRRTKIYEGEEQKQQYNLGADLSANVIKKKVNGKDYYTVNVEEFNINSDLQGSLNETQTRDNDSLQFGRKGAITTQHTGDARSNAVFYDLPSMEAALEEITKTHNGLTTTKIDKSIPRSLRNNNPLAMTTAVAKSLGFVEGVDYVDNNDTFGSSDGNKTYTTATFTGSGSPVDKLVSQFDKVALADNSNIFTTGGGKPRWSYLKEKFGKVFTNKDWLSLTETEKYNIIKEMSIVEGGGNVFKL